MKQKGIGVKQMNEQLNRIEDKLGKLTIAVEHRLTRLETVQKGVIWLICTATTGVVSLFIMLLDL